MKKIILFSLLAICSVVAKAQDSYADAVRTFFEKNASAFNVDSDELPSDMVEVMYDCLIETYKEEGITIAEMEEVTAIYESEQGKAFVEKAKLIQGKEAQDKLQKVLMTSIAPLFMGGDPQPVKTPEVSASYKKKFHEYCVTTDATSTFDSVFDALTGVLAGQPEADMILDKMKKFFSKESENLMLVLCSDIYTEEILDYGIMFGKKPAFKHMTKANQKFMGNFMQKLMSKYGM